jgi:hypothetical protein
MDRSPRPRTRLAPAAAVGRWVWSGAWRWVVLTFGVLAVAAGPGWRVLPRDGLPRRG